MSNPNDVWISKTHLKSKLGKHWDSLVLFAIQYGNDGAYIHQNVVREWLDSLHLKWEQVVQEAEAEE